MGIVLFGIVKNTPAPDAGYRLLLDDLNRTKNDLDFAYANFQNVVEPDLIDAYIYEVNAIMKRYQFLMAQADLLSSNPQTTETSLIAEALH